LQKKPPKIGGEIPRIYVLDEQQHLNELGFIPKVGEDICDMYCVYPSGLGIVIEHKAKSLRNAITQLQDTARSLQRINKRVNGAIIIAEKMNKYEQKQYKRDPKTRKIIRKYTDKPISITTQNDIIEIQWWTPREIDDTYKTPQQTPLGGGK